MFRHIQWLQLTIQITSQLCCLLFYHICLLPLPAHFQLDPHFSFSAMTGEEKIEARRVLSRNIQDYLLGWHLAVKPKSYCSNPSNMRCCACSVAGIKPLFCMNWVEIVNCCPPERQIGKYDFWSTKTLGKFPLATTLCTCPTPEFGM